MRGITAFPAAIIFLSMLGGCQSPTMATGSLPRDALAPLAAPVTLARASSAMPAGSPAAEAPTGFVSFCARTPDQCMASDISHSTVTLDAATWNKMTEINRRINDTVKPMTDAQHFGVEDYWTLVLDGYGDCEDVALTKRKALMDAGLPPGALRMAVVITSRGERHAVLTIATDHGDYVLDNLAADVLPWAQSGYIWLARQDPGHRLGWVTLDAMPDIPTGSVLTLR